MHTSTPTDGEKNLIKYVRRTCLHHMECNWIEQDWFSPVVISIVVYLNYFFLFGKGKWKHLNQWILDSGHIRALDIINILNIRGSVPLTVLQCWPVKHTLSILFLSHTFISVWVSDLLILFSRNSISFCLFSAIKCKMYQWIF